MPEQQPTSFAGPLRHTKSRQISSSSSSGRSSRLSNAPGDAQDRGDREAGRGSTSWKTKHMPLQPRPPNEPASPKGRMSYHGLAGGAVSFKAGHEDGLGRSSMAGGAGSSTARGSAAATALVPAPDPRSRFSYNGRTGSKSMSGAVVGAGQGGALQVERSQQSMPGNMGLNAGLLAARFITTTANAAAATEQLAVQASEGSLSEDGRSVQAQVAKWKQAAAAEGLLETEPSPARARVPQAQCGVSLWWLQQFVGSLRASPALRSCLDSTEELVSKVLMPATRLSPINKFRLYNLVPEGHTGRPGYYVIHTWSDSLETMLDTLCSHFASAPPPGVPQAPAPKAVLEDIYVWLDIVAVCQHTTSQAQQAGPELLEVREALAASEHGALVVMDHEGALLSRCWCMYEIWASVYYGDCLRLEVVFPEGITLEQMCDFQTRCLGMDVTRGVCTRPIDKQKILSEVKHCVGLKRMSQLLPDALMRSARHGLRWGGGLARKAMYCALLLRAGEHAQAQLVLHSIPEIHDDEKVLQDIRDVFKMYDTDGSGELDTKEFVEVLGFAGFTKEEAMDIFSKVDTDGGGTVSLIEFEKWWIETQRQESTRYAHKVELSAEALLETLDAMVALLEREKLKQYIPFYKTERAKLSSSRELPKSRPLAPSPVKGDWKGVAEQCAWKVNTRDYRGAAKMMYDLLMWNCDTLQKHPDTLLKPDADTDPEDALEAVCTFFDMWAACLARDPATERQAEHFKRAARDLRERHAYETKGVLDDDDESGSAHTPRSFGSKRFGSRRMMSRRRSGTLGGAMSGEKEAAKQVGRWVRKHSRKPKGVRMTKLFPGRLDMEREQIVSNMVRLKYGSNTLLSSKLIVEAEKSLSQWMAAQKEGLCKGNHRSDNRGAVRDFSYAYMHADPDAMQSPREALARKASLAAKAGASSSAGPSSPRGLGGTGSTSIAAAAALSDSQLKLPNIPKLSLGGGEGGLGAGGGDGGGGRGPSRMFKAASEPVAHTSSIMGHLVARGAGQGSLMGEVLGVPLGGLPSVKTSSSGASKGGASAALLCRGGVGPPKALRCLSEPGRTGLD